MTEVRAMLEAETDPTGFVLAVADLREARAKAATPGPYEAHQYKRDSALVGGEIFTPDIDRRPIPYASTWPDAEHIAAEANPAHALAEVALWRHLAKGHAGHEMNGITTCRSCDGAIEFPCADLLAVVAAARAYLGEGGQR